MPAGRRALPGAKGLPPQDEPQKVNTSRRGQKQEKRRRHWESFQSQLNDYGLEEDPRRLTPAEKFAAYSIFAIGGNSKDVAAHLGISVNKLEDERVNDAIFGLYCQEGIARCKLKALKKISRAEDWKAASWYLSKAYSEEFGDKAAGDRALLSKITSDAKKAVQDVLERLGVPEADVIAALTAIDGVSGSRGEATTVEIDLGENAPVHQA